MICPKCGGGNVLSQVVTETNSFTEEKRKGFGCIKSCLGFLLFSFPGILCGLCGMGKGKTRSQTKSESKVVHVCQECGYHF